MDDSTDQTEQLIKVLPYSFSALCSAIAEGVASPSPPDEDKYPLSYFKEYFQYFLQKNAITMVIEQFYIDHDFMEDYAAYYVRCFPGKYVSHCIRLHFFNTEFSEREFCDGISKGPAELEEKLRPTYLGFTVIKPLPQTFVGRTCLEVYSPEEHRKYPVSFETQVHLMGMRFSIESVPFQQQDTIVAACATSALWSVFHGTGALFYHRIPSPTEITQTATENSPSLGRSFPNRGLTIEQMSQAVRKMGLEPDLLAPCSTFDFQATVYGYLKEGFPLVLVAGLYDTSESDPSTGGPLFMGLHAVGITGYSIGYPSCTPNLDTGTSFESSRIDKLYVHDDQIGPFARLEFVESIKLHRDRCIVQDKGLITVAGMLPEECQPIVLKSSWPSNDGKKKNAVVFIADSVIIPIYHKIRIPVEDILARVMEHDLAIKAAVKDVGALEWDVFLTTAGGLKGDLRERYCDILESDYLLSLLRGTLPKYIWRAIAQVNGEPAFELWYDATDIEQGDYLLRMVGIDKEFLKKLT